MTIISKAGLDAELDITRGRVSQYITRGMPTRKDGKLDREKCIAWIKRNVEPTTSSSGYFAASKTQTRRRRDEESDNPVDMAMNAAVGSMFVITRGIAAEAARQDGVSDAQIDEIWSVAFDLAKRRGDAIATQMLGLTARGDYWPDLETCRKFAIGDDE